MLGKELRGCGMIAINETFVSKTACSQGPGIIAKEGIERLQDMENDYKSCLLDMTEKLHIRTRHTCDLYKLKPGRILA